MKKKLKAVCGKLGRWALVVAITGLVSAPMAVPVTAEAQVANHIDLTLANGTNNGLGVRFTYSNGITRAAFSQFKFSRIEVTASPTLTNAATIGMNRIRAGVTSPVPWTVIVASNTTWLSIVNTNEMWNFLNDAFDFYTVYTNAFTFSLPIVEQ